MALISAARRLMPADLQGMVWNSKWTRMVSSSAASLEPPAEPKPVALSKLKDSFNDGTSISYLEELEEKYQRDPNSVDKSWATFFRNMGEAQAACGICMRQPRLTHLAATPRLTPLRIINVPPYLVPRPRRLRRGHGRGLPCFRGRQDHVPVHGGSHFQPDHSGEHAPHPLGPLIPGEPSPRQLGLCLCFQV